MGVTLIIKIMKLSSYFIDEYNSLSKGMIMCACCNRVVRDEEYVVTGGDGYDLPYEESAVCPETGKLTEYEDVTLEAFLYDYMEENSVQVDELSVVEEGERLIEVGFDLV